MKMDSQKSTSAQAQAKAPRRARGHARVASLLEAASAEFAEKGYDGATMTAIAARAQSSIGSLYQFFPTKEQVAGALVEQYVAELEATLGRLRQAAPTLDVAQLAEQLTRLFVTFRAAYPAFAMLAETPELTLPGTADIRARMRAGIAEILAAVAPHLPGAALLLRATLVQHLMKTAVALSRDGAIADPRAAVAELQRVLQHYLEDTMRAGGSGGKA
jgi:AcrR family transcriptional regulator